MYNYNNNLRDLYYIVLNSRGSISHIPSPVTSDTQIRVCMSSSKKITLTNSLSLFGIAVYYTVYYELCVGT